MATRTLNTLERALDVIESALKEETYPISGFVFKLDTPENEPEEVLAPLRGMRIPSGFKYRFGGVLYGEQDIIKGDSNE